MGGVQGRDDSLSGREFANLPGGPPIPSREGQGVGGTSHPQSNPYFQGQGIEPFALLEPLRMIDNSKVLGFFSACVSLEMVTS